MGILAAQTVNPSAYTGLKSLELLAGAQARDPAHAAFYTAADGTSVATPHVAGVVALMVETAPCLTAAQALGILQARPWTGAPWGTTTRTGTTHGGRACGRLGGGCALLTVAS